MTSFSIAVAKPPLLLLPKLQFDSHTQISSEESRFDKPIEAPYSPERSKVRSRGGPGGEFRAYPLPANLSHLNQRNNCVLKRRAVWHPDGKGVHNRRWKKSLQGFLCQRGHTVFSKEDRKNVRQRVIMNYYSSSHIGLPPFLNPPDNIKAFDKVIRVKAAEFQSDEEHIVRGSAKRFKGQLFYPGIEPSTHRRK